MAKKKKPRKVDLRVKSISAPAKKDRNRDRGMLDLFTRLELVDAKEEQQEFLNSFAKAVEFWHYLAITLGRTEQAQKLIQEIFESDSYMYEKAKRNYFQNVSIFHATVDVEEYIQMSLGIIAYAVENKDFEDTNRLVKRLNGALFRKCQQYGTAKTHSILTTLQEEFDKRDRHMQGLSLIVLELSLLPLMYFMYSEQVFFTHLDRIETSIEGALAAYKHYVHSEVRSETPWDLHQIGKIWIKSFVNASFGNAESKTVLEIVQALYDEGDYFKPEILKALIYLEEDMHPIKLQEFADLLTSTISNFFTYKTLISISITREEWGGIVELALYHSRETDSQFDVLLAQFIAITALRKDTIRTRTKLLTESKMEVAYQEHNLKEQVDELTEKNKQLELELEKYRKGSVLQADHQKVVNTAIALEKKVAQQAQELVAVRGDLKELHSLREFIYNQSKFDDDAVDESVDYAKELENETIIVVGGHNNWISHMKTVLPNAIYIPVDGTSTGRDFQKIKVPNARVFINTNYNNHGNYYRVSSMLTDYNNLFYIDKTNKNIALAYIYDCIKNRKK